MPEATVGVASNVRPAQNIPAALELLDVRLGVLRRAPVYRTPAIARPEQAHYWNTAAVVRAPNMHDLRTVLRDIEAHLGRVRGPDPYAPRTIDLDILTWDGRIVDPDVPQRWFLQRLVEDLQGTNDERRV